MHKSDLERLFCRVLGMVGRGAQMWAILGHKESLKVYMFTDIAAILQFAIAMPIAHPRNCYRFPRQEKQCCIAIKGCDERSLAMCDFELRFQNPKPVLSAS